MGYRRPRPFRESLVALLICIAIALLVGCGSRKGVPPEKINPAPVLGGQEQKDATVLAEADAIDEIAPGAKQHTDAQRAAVAAAPASDVTALVDRYVRADERKTNEIASLTRQLEKAKKELAEIEASVWRKVQFYGSLALYAVAIASLVLAVFRAKAAIGSGLAIVDGLKSTATLITLSATCFIVARFMAAAWFWWACGGIVAAFAGYVGILAVRERRGHAAANALTPVRKVLDRLYDDAEPELKARLDETLFKPLSEEMKTNPAAKTYIHLDRAAA